MKPVHRRLSADLSDLGARVVIGSLFLALAWRLGRDFAQTGRPTDLLLLVGEGLVVILTLLRRNATMVDRRMIVRVITGISMASPFLVRPGPVDGVERARDRKRRSCARRPRVIRRTNAHARFRLRAILRHRQMAPRPRRLLETVTSDK